MRHDRQLILVSNRLPLTFVKTPPGWEAQSSNGGLVSALLPISGQYGGYWVGWTGTEYDPGIENALTDSCPGLPRTSIVPVFLSDHEKRCFYQGCANETIWPLFHGLELRPTYNSEYWRVYREVNGKFADAIRRIARRDDFVWVHDYHLMLVAEAMAGRGLSPRLAYFHHIPFPPPEMFVTLPWHREVLSALLEFDSIGFQTDRDRANFLACVSTCFHDFTELPLANGVLAQADGRRALVGVHSISIEYHRWEADAQAAEVTSRVRQMRSAYRQAKMLIGVDRLDHSKGILERLRAFDSLLSDHPELRGTVVLNQVTVPSREEIASYQRLGQEIGELVRGINLRFGTPDWTPVAYEHRQLTRRELLARYRAADVALVTPLNDGMNLVAKEFCASRIDDSGVLVLSECAGAAQELGAHAILADPRNCRSLSTAIYRALHMGALEQQSRMSAMRKRIRDNDVFAWARSVLPHTDSFNRLPAPALIAS